MINYNYNRLFSDVSDIYISDDFDVSIESSSDESVVISSLKSEFLLIEFSRIIHSFYSSLDYTYYLSKWSLFIWFPVNLSNKTNPPIPLLP